ncbi:MAG: YjbH domain-containing protein [Bacteroidales bacterium]|jgi:hypothetical protein
MEALGAILLLLVSSYTVCAQSTVGITGLLNSPSAEMSQDGTVKVGGNILNKEITPDYWNYHTINYFLNITFLPFFEASLTNTALDLWNEGRFSNVDRSINFKLRPLMEGKYWPAVVIGSNDFITTSSELVTPVSGNRFFGKVYLALSKHIDIKGHIIGLHTAYNYVTSSSLEIDFPVSGGISYSPAFYKKMNIIAEYDTKNFNVGANLIFLRYIYLQVLMQNLKYMSIGVHFQFTI